MTTQPIFASNYPPTEATAALAPLLKPTGKWSLTPNGQGIERPFKFKGFKKCWEFMNTVAPECTKQKHHPEWSNVYNTAYIRWTTHSPPGISGKDVVMARFCDEVAREMGEVESVDVQDVERELVERVGVEGGDCCVPKKKS
ncbi:PCD-like protein [Glarea lozoyensis ATCC 20868]|uniref:4a-hydroxytetrahydrobiopterin dehydratase n=1 Tax=Glarea lozoyensis (strain ATCC 20868 / MF5171) TaxID=1116229 RepID=S3CGT2_GLAL2|nr:PCD-like protein [Glarea lozoyensis ATCC 20868]EPE24499.1 PCD-like protein [Glarea lozoyensis ATCC 20868]